MLWIFWGFLVLSKCGSAKQWMKDTPGTAKHREFAGGSQGTAPVCPPCPCSQWQLDTEQDWALAWHSTGIFVFLLCDINLSKMSSFLLASADNSSFLTHQEWAQDTEFRVRSACSGKPSQWWFSPRHVRAIQYMTSQCNFHFFSSRVSEKRFSNKTWANAGAQHWLFPSYFLLNTKASSSFWFCD